MHAKNTDRAELFAEKLVSSYVDAKDFADRPWLAEAIEDALGSPEARIVLLTGEPGSGKTAMLAWMARSDPVTLRYFIRRDSRHLLNRGDARSFLLAIGHQLAMLRPELFQPERLEIVVRQDVDEIAAGGRAIGIRVEDLAVSPFYETALAVEQRVGLVAGTMTGLSVGRMVADERLLELDVLQELALFAPGRLLERTDAGTRLVVLIDAVDELRYTEVRQTVLDWLAHCPELPSNIRFLVASRPDDRLLSMLRARHRSTLRELALDMDAPSVHDDLARYASRFAQRMPGIDKRLLAEAVGKAQGNFQYLAAVFRAVAIDGSAFDLRDVPSGLRELYGYFLTLVAADVADERVEVADRGVRERLPAWEGLYQPVLGVLAVAREPLTAQQIMSFAALQVQARWLTAALARLRQFLDEVGGGVRLYHGSLQEFLTADATRDSYPDVYVDPVEWNRAVADGALRSLGADWSACADEYVLAHLPTHLIGAGSERDLARVLTSVEFLEAKARRLGMESVLEDVAAGVESAGSSEPSLLEMFTVLDSESHFLRRWLAADDPAYFAQQVHNRAVEEGAAELAARARSRLRRTGGSSFALRWRGRRASPLLLRTLAGHEKQVQAVSITPDGERIVSGSEDGTVRVWKLATGRQIYELGKQGAVVALAVLGDDRVVSGLKDGTLSVWSLDDGLELGSWPAHRGSISGLAALEGGTILSWSADGTARLWDPETRSEIRMLAVDVSALAVAASAGMALIGTVGGELTLWDLRDGRPVRVLGAHDRDSAVENPGASAEVKSIAVAPDAARALSASRDGLLAFWDLALGECVSSADCGENVPTLIRISPDGRRAITLFFELPPILLDMETCDALCALKGHQFVVTDVLFAPDGRTAVTLSMDHTLRVWDAETGAERHVLSGHGSFVISAAISADGRRIVSGGLDDVLKVWELPAADSGGGGGDRPAAGHVGDVRDVAFGAGDRYALSASTDGTLRVWDVGTGRHLHCMETDGQYVTALATLPDGRTVVSASVGGTLTAWDMDSGEAIREYVGHTGRVDELVVHGDRIVSASGDRTVRIWDAANARTLHEIPAEVTSMAIADEWLVAATTDQRYERERNELISSDNGIRIWDLGSGREVGVLAGHLEPVFAFALSADGRLAVSGSDDRTVRIWDLGRRAELLALRGHESAVRAVAVTSDGRRVVSAAQSWRPSGDGADPSLLVWDARTGELLHRISAHMDTVAAIRVLPGDRLIVSAGWDGRLVLSSLESGAVLASTRVEGRIEALDVSADGRIVIVGETSRSVYCFDLAPATSVGHDD